MYQPQVNAGQCPTVGSPLCSQSSHRTKVQFQDCVRKRVQTRGAKSKSYFSHTVHPPAILRTQQRQNRKRRWQIRRVQKRCSFQSRRFKNIRAIGTRLRAQFAVQIQAPKSLRTNSSQYSTVIRTTRPDHKPARLSGQLPVMAHGDPMCERHL
jgi:hypothetical protein